MNQSLPATILIATFLLIGSPVARAETEFNCTPTREYMAALAYLRSATELGLKEEESRRIAERVSAHCTGSSDRFIRISQLLVSSGMSGTDALKVGLEMAAADEKVASTYVTVFRHAFLEKYLDLSLSASMRIAKSLSVEFDGDVQAVGRDFEQFVQFCTSENKLGMPKAKCASWAANLARKGQEFGGGIAKSFLQAFNFLTSEDGPALAYGQAAVTAAELVEISPNAVKNFVQAYQYGLSKDGLRMDTKSAILFARKMAKHTRYSKPTPKLKGEG